MAVEPDLAPGLDAPALGFIDGLIERIQSAADGVCSAVKKKDEISSSDGSTGRSIGIKLRAEYDSKNYIPNAETLPSNLKKKGKRVPWTRLQLEYGIKHWWCERNDSNTLDLLTDGEYSNGVREVTVFEINDECFSKVFRLADRDSGEPIPVSCLFQITDGFGYFEFPVDRFIDDDSDDEGGLISSPLRMINNSNNNDDEDEEQSSSLLSLSAVRVRLVAGDVFEIPHRVFDGAIISCSKYLSFRSFQCRTASLPMSKDSPPPSPRPSSASTADLLSLLPKEVGYRTGHNGRGLVLGNRAAAYASYPHIREYNGTLFVSGSSSRRSDGSNTHVGADKDGESGLWTLDARAQTRAVLENIQLILNHCGASLCDCLSMTVYLVDFQDYQAMNEVYNEYFDGLGGPTRTTVAVARLPHPNLLIEIQTIAAVPSPIAD